MKPTLQTVADAVGVSRSTVSNAYSRPDQLSPKLRAKILKKAQQLGYAGPDPTARSLRRGQAGAMGVLLAPGVSYAFTDPYAVEFMSGLAETLENRDTGILLLPLQDDGDDAASVVQAAAVDGFCVYCMPGWYRAMDAVWARSLPVVNSPSPAPDGANALYVGIDEVAAARTAAQHLVDLGHRRVALISNGFAADDSPGPVSLPSLDGLGSYVTQGRLRGYREVFAEAGVAWSDILTINAAGDRRRGGAEAAAYALDHAHRPTAIAAFSDVLALGVMDALATRDLRAGRDVSVIGFDDIPDAAAAKLTTIRQSAVDRGRIAAELLLDPPDDPADRNVVLSTELVVRASTASAQKGRL